MLNDVVIIEGARTPFGSFGRSFKEISANDLGAISAKEPFCDQRLTLMKLIK